MGRHIVFIFLILCSGVSTAQNFAVTEPVVVSSGMGNYHPQVEVLGDDQLGVIWTNAATNGLYFAKRTGMDQFAAPLKLNPAGLEVQDYNWSGADLCAEGNNVYVVFRSLGYETGHVYLVKSTDKGETFGDTVRVDNMPADYTQYPDVAVFNDTVYVTHMKHGFTVMNPQMVVSRSTDGGATFEAEVDVTGWLGLEVCDCCQPEIIVDAERIIVFYRENDLNTRDIKAVVSYDRGATFTEYLVIDDHNWTISACPSTGADARFLNGDNAVCAYKTNLSGEPKIFLEEYNVETSGSVSTVEILMDGASNTGINYPQLATENNLLAIVWEGLGQSTDVFFNASDTGPAGILSSNAMNVTDQAGSQSKPDIVVLNGAFHIVYAELSGTEVHYIRVTAVNGTYDPVLPAAAIYPNPFSTQFTIALIRQEDFVLTVFSADGKEVLDAAYAYSADQLDIESGSLAPGTYMVRLQYADYVEVHRLVKNP